MADYVAPALDLDAFHCPRCHAFAHQRWYRALEGFSRFVQGQRGGEVYRLPPIAYTVAVCQRCDGISLWEGEVLFHPAATAGPAPHDDMPEDVATDYREAGTVLEMSPRASAALLRLALQKLCADLGQTGRDLDKDIAALVKDGLPNEVAKALDIVRVVGNNAVHPGQMDLRDDRQTALVLFGLINLIVERMIVLPKSIDELYSRLPKGALEHIAQRDGVSDSPVE